MTAKTKKKAAKSEFIPEDLRQSAHRIWLAGLGAVAMAEDEGGKLFRKLVERGEGMESRSREAIKDVQSKVEEKVGEARDRAESTWAKLEDTIDEKIGATLKRLGVPSREEIQKLTKKVEELTIKVDKLRPAAKKKTAKKRA